MRINHGSSFPIVMGLAEIRRSACARCLSIREAAFDIVSVSSGHIARPDRCILGVRCREINA